MPQYSYEVAKSVLNEGDKNRILCLYLSSDHSSVNWAKATKDSGSVSETSFRVLVNKMMRKIKQAGGEISSSGEAVATPSTPKTPTSKGKARKRKAKDDFSSESERDWTPSPKRGRKGSSGESSIKSESTIEDENVEGTIEVGAGEGPGQTIE